MENESLRFVRRGEVVFNSIDDELLMLDPDQGKYFGTGVVGKRIWELLENPMTVMEIVSQLIEEFDVTEEACRRDVEDFIGSLHKLKLVENL